MLTIEQEIVELEAAGWKAQRPRYIWKSPNGALYLGPHGAWKCMRRQTSGVDPETAADSEDNASRDAKH